MKKKKASLAVAVMAVALLAAAPPVFATPQSEAASPAGVGVTPPGQLPVVREKVTLTAFIPSVGFIQDLKTNASAMWLEKTTNVHIEWIETSKVDAKNKLSILLAGGDYPDMIQGTFGYGLAPQDLTRYGGQGIFIALNDLIEKQGFYVKEMFRALPIVKPAITSPDGRIYGLPAVFTDDYHMTMRQKLWINQTWLERLGLKMPGTTEELYATLKAFKDKDANGNGDPNDEIPLSGAKRNIEDVAMWIMNAFVPAAGPDDSGDAQLNNYEFIVDDKVFFNADKAAFRDGLRYINRLYREALLDVAALTQDRDQIKPLVDGGSAARVGAVASHHPGNFANVSGAGTGRFRDYAPLPPIKGPSGRANTPWFIDMVIYPGQLVITDRCKLPEAALRWADTFFTLDFAMVDRGIEGVHWARVAAGENLVALNGGPAKYKYLKQLAPSDNAQINLGPGWTRDIKNEFAKSSGFSYEEMLYNATKLYDPYKVRRFPYATAPIREQDVAEFNDLRRTLHTYVGESVDRFIIGDLSLDTQWDAYVSRLEQIGLSRYVKILQDAFSAAK